MMNAPKDNVFLLLVLTGCLSCAVLYFVLRDDTEKIVAEVHFLYVPGKDSVALSVSELELQKLLVVSREMEIRNEKSRTALQQHPDMKISYVSGAYLGVLEIATASEKLSILINKEGFPMANTGVVLDNSKMKYEIRSFLIKNGIEIEK